jgi:hypothetical protein
MTDDWLNRLNNNLAAAVAHDPAASGSAKVDPSITVGSLIESLERDGLRGLAAIARKAVSAVELLGPLAECFSNGRDVVVGPLPLAPIYADDFETANSFLKLPIAKHYQELLRSKGFSPLEAWFLPQIIKNGAPLMAERTDLARRLLRPLLRKLSSITKNSTLVRSRAAPRLLAALKNPEAMRLVDSGLKKMPSPASISHFVAVLERAAERNADACEEAGILAGCLASHVPDSRGRPISEASCAHRALIYCLKMNGHNARYTVADGKYIDPVSQATRETFGLKFFDPREALRGS